MNNDLDPGAPSSPSNDELLDDLLFSYVDRLNAGEILDKEQIRAELFMWILWPALALLMLEILLRTTRLRRFP